MILTFIGKNRYVHKSKPDFGRYKITMRNSIFVCLILSTLAVGCTRAKKDVSSLRIKVPDAVGAQGKVDAMSVPAGFKKCYAVNVSASDISSSSRSCGKALGTYTGYVAEGSTLEVSVARGSNRSVDLYMYLTPDTGAACPALTTSCDAARECNSYKVASATGVDTSQAETSLSLTVAFPGLTQNAVSVDAPASTLCSGSVAAALTTGGDIVDAGLNGISGAPSTPAAATFYKQASATTFEIVTRSLMTGGGLHLATVRPQVRGLVRKPGSEVLYGWLSDNSIVLVGPTGEYADITAADCPFTTCTPPRWFKSIALGQGPHVFGLDWGGGLWRVESDGSLTAISSFPAYIHQVSMN